MSGPLEGIRGIVLTQAWAGALCTELMAMMGAEIIQIEVRKRPDSWRGAYDAPILSRVAEQPTTQHPWNCSPLFNSVNLGKQSLTLDLSTPEGIDIYRRLVPFADVVAENFSPRVMKNLGLHYEALCEIKPDIILASLSAYGSTGPYFNVPGIGGTIEPMSGMSYLLGYEDGPPMNSGAMFPDAIAGFYGFAAIVTALLHRDRTGEGQYIDLSMQEANLTVIGEAALEYSMTGNVRSRLGNRHRTFAPHGIYPAAGDDRWVAIAAESDDQWRALFEAAGHREWASDARFTDNAARKANEDALDAAIAAWTASEDRDALADRLASAGVIAAPVLDGLDLAEDEVLRDRGYVVEVTHPETGTWPQIALPMHLDRTPGGVPRPAPLQGEHSAEVLERFLGIGRDEYEELVRKGVTGSGPPD